MAEKLRLDELLVQLKIVESRHKAQAMILAGTVLVNEVPVDKAGTKVRADSEIRIKGSVSKFVGRGGDKIDAAFDHFLLNPEKLVCIDIGASTGGFTDAMLQRGAAKVYAIDVGYNQLDYRLRVNKRVVVMERVNAKELDVSMFNELPSLATIDVSFIGLRKVLLPVVSVLAPVFNILALVKPQFELGPEYVEKGGVVNKVEDQLLAVKLVEDFATKNGLESKSYIPSPLRGGKSGNQEYFLCLGNGNKA